jgi:hypothetical protein
MSHPDNPCGDPMKVFYALGDAVIAHGEGSPESRAQLDRLGALRRCMDAAATGALPTSVQ